MPCASGTAPRGAVPERFKIPYSDGVCGSLSLSLSLCVPVPVRVRCVRGACLREVPHRVRGAADEAADAGAGFAVAADGCRLYYNLSGSPDAEDKVCLRAAVIITCLRGRNACRQITTSSR